MVDFITWLIALDNFLTHLKETYEIKTVIIIICLNLPFEIKNQLTFYKMVIFATLFRRCPTLWKSTLKMAMLFRRCLTLFNSTLKNTTCFNVVNFNVDVHNFDLTFCDVATSYQPKNNVEPTSKCLLRLILVCISFQALADLYFVVWRVF